MVAETCISSNTPTVAWRHVIGVLVINSTCKDKRNSGNHDIIVYKFTYSTKKCL